MVSDSVYEAVCRQRDAALAKVVAQEKVIAAAGAFCYELAHGRLWPWLNLTDVQRQKIQIVAEELACLPQDAASGETA